MTLSIAIALIVIADLALLATLAYVMSRASKLEPHVSALSASASAPGPEPEPEPVGRTRRARARRPPRTSSVPVSASSR